MEYSIKLRVHGVPSEGQQIWGADIAESYVENFYGRKSSVLAQLIVEIIPSNGINNYYYTYLRGKDIIGRDGRAGSSYFALTLCMNHLYTDLVNLYNVLDASFNKFIVGSVLKQNESGNYSFITSDFNQHDTLFKELEKEIIHYLMQFSSNSDFISSNKVKQVSNGRISQINILECNHQVALSQINANGGVSISPNFPSMQVTNILKQKDIEIATVKRQSENKITNIEEQCNLQIQEAKKDRDNGIKKVEEKYANSASEISSLKDQLQEIQKNYQKLKSDNTDLEKQLQYLKQIKLENERKNTEIERLNNLITKIKSHLASLSEIANCLGVGQLESERPKTKPKYQKSKNTHREDNEGYRLNLKHIVIAISSLLILFIGVFCFKGCFLNSEKDLTLKMNNEKISENNTPKELNNSTKEVYEIEQKPENMQPTIKSIKDAYPNMRIDISGISQNKPMKYDSDIKYIASLKGVDGGDLGGEWKSDDFKIEGNQIKPIHNGNCIITYVIYDSILISRTIDVK